MIYPISVTGYDNKVNEEYYVIRKPEMIHAAMLERNNKGAFQIVAVKRQL
jgi:hypothetical protein